MFKPTDYYHDQHGMHPVFRHFDGNVGIGTTSPENELTVVGIIQSEGDSANNVGTFELKDTGSNNFWHMTMRGTDHVTETDDFKLFYYNGSWHEWLRFDTSASTMSFLGGNVGIGTTSPSEKLDIDGDAIRVRSPQTPASAGATGTAGMICWDSSYIYVCVAADTWKRVLIETW